MTRHRAWMPVGVVLVALVLGLIRLGAQPLSFDELFTRDTATLSWSGIWEAARDTEAPHLVYYSLLKPWLAAFGTSDWALRLPSVLFGALAAGATALLGRRLFGELAGLVAGLALAASSYFVSWSQAARGYTLAVLLAVVATYAFVRACEERSTTWWAIWAASLAAAGWVSVFAFSVAAAHLAAFLLFRPRPELRVPVLAACVALAAFLPQLVLVVTGDNGQLDWIPTPTPRHVAVGMWDWASRNPIAVLAGAIGVVQLFREAVPLSGALEGCARRRLARRTAHGDAARIDLPAGVRSALRAGRATCAGARHRRGGRLPAPPVGSRARRRPGDHDDSAARAALRGPGRPAHPLIKTPPRPTGGRGSPRSRRRRRPPPAESEAGAGGDAAAPDTAGAAHRAHRRAAEGRTSRAESEAGAG